MIGVTSTLVTTSLNYNQIAGITVKELWSCAYTRYWKNRMYLEEDNFNNVPKRTNVNASTDRELVYSVEERTLCLSCKCKT
jgi:hypothetical protein